MTMCYFFVEEYPFEDFMLMRLSIDQLTISGGGSASPGTVNLPGAYSQSDPGILVNIHASLATYIAPGPTVYAGGSIKSAGSGCVGVEAGSSVGPAYTPTNIGASPTGSTGGGSSGGGSGCTAAKYAQCGGEGYTGCTSCVVSDLIILTLD